MEVTSQEQALSEILTNPVEEEKKNEHSSDSENEKKKKEDLKKKKQRKPLVRLKPENLTNAQQNKEIKGLRLLYESMDKLKVLDKPNSTEV